MSGEVWNEVYDRLAQLIRPAHHARLRQHTSTRRASRAHLGERSARRTSPRITAVSRVSIVCSGAAIEVRRAERPRRDCFARARYRHRRRESRLPARLDSFDRELLQRVGRSNHTVAGFPKGRIFPLSRDELVECAAIVDSVRRGELDRLEIPEKPLDILAQQIVAAVAAEEWGEDDLFRTVRRAYPYRNLEREQFDSISVLAEGFSTKRGRRSTYLHHDAVNQRIRGRRGARLAAITSGGAIPDTADYAVVLEPSDLVIGTVNEDFAIESLQGDIFQLGNTSWRVLRVEQGKVRVEDAHGQPPSIPFWLGEAPARTHELSISVSRLREEVATRIDAGENGSGLILSRP